MNRKQRFFLGLEPFFLLYSSFFFNLINKKLISSSVCVSVSVSLSLSLSLDSEGNQEEATSRSSISTFYIFNSLRCLNVVTMTCLSAYLYVRARACVCVALKSIPPEAERAFSAAGLFFTKRRTRLDDKTVFSGNTFQGNLNFLF